MNKGQYTGMSQQAVQETTTRVSLQQVLNAQLLELGDEELLMRIDNELNENSALEEGGDELPDEEDMTDSMDDYAEEEIHVDDISYDIDSEELPVYTAQTEAKTEIPIGDTRSFIDELRDQMAEHEMADDKQRELVEYLIGSLNDNGFIDRQLRQISDDLLFHHNIDASEQEVENALHVLQRFDPPGIGARDLQECMRIQIERKLEDLEEDGDSQRKTYLQLALKMINHYFHLFRRNEQERIRQEMNVDATTLKNVIAELARLNPRPGLALNEEIGDNAKPIEPDFIIETTIDGNISFVLRGGRLPRLRVNPTYKEMVTNANTKQMTALQRADYQYLRDNVERASTFIQAIRQRQETLTRIMKVIIDCQRDFMFSQDEADLKPLTGSELAKRLDISGSTVSRAIRHRYAMLDGNLYPLTAFFMRTKRNAQGEEVLKTQVEATLQELIDNEDKNNPLTDGELETLMNRRGLNIKRRTVALYRDKMGIPTAKLRKQF